MKILLVAYPAAWMLGGGLLSQVEGTIGGLEAAGIGVTRFRGWETIDLAGFDLFHLFGANIGTCHTAAWLDREGLPGVVSPIFFTRRSPAAVRWTVRATRLAARFCRGVWTDYGIASDVCLRASRVLPNTAAEGEMVARGLGVPRERIRVVPNGVNGRFDGADPALFREATGLDRFILTVGFVGMERKNTLRLFEAVEGLDLPLVVIGGVWDGPYARRCLRLAEGNPRIRHLGALPPDSEMLASACAACDVFVLPSLYETPGIAALEAGLAGARVVITPNGGTRDYFGDLAEYVNPRSVESIRAGIRRALAKPAGDGLRDRIRREYTWPRVARRTAAVYEEVLSDRGAPRSRRGNASSASAVDRND